MDNSIAMFVPVWMLVAPLLLAIIELIGMPLRSTRTSRAYQHRRA